MENLFKEIADKENAQHKVVHEKAYSPFVISPLTRKSMGLKVKSHSFILDYKNSYLKATYLLSSDEMMGKIECQLPSNLNLPTFHISNRSHYWRLFNRKANILKVQSEDEVFKKYIRTKLDYFQLEQFARESLFEPSIHGGVKDNTCFLLTSYSLAFPTKKEVLYPMIKLYKSIIDFATSKQNH